MSLISLGLLASLAAGLATGLGTVSVLFTKRAPERLLDAMLGFAAGGMLATDPGCWLAPELIKENEKQYERLVSE